MPSIRSKSGFTVVELLIVTPFVVLIVATIVGLVVSLTGDALVARERTNTVFIAQNALDRIEQDVRISNTILETSGTLPTPQGRNSSFTGTTAFATPASYLVLEQFGTTQSPYNSTRSLVYNANQPNPCGSDQARNIPMSIKVIYYLDGTTLKRRVIVPTSGPFCGDVWQRNTCKTGLNTGNQCKAYDEVIAENVSSISYAYYQAPGDTSPVSSPDATTRTVLATITVTKPVAGRTITNTSVMRVSTTALE